MEPRRQMSHEMSFVSVCFREMDNVKELTIYPLAKITSAEYDTFVEFFESLIMTYEPTRLNIFLNGINFHQGISFFLKAQSLSSLYLISNQALNTDENLTMLKALNSYLPAFTPDVKIMFFNGTDFCSSSTQILQSYVDRELAARFNSNENLQGLLENLMLLQQTLRQRDLLEFKLMVHEETIKIAQAKIQTVESTEAIAVKAIDKIIELEKVITDLNQQLFVVCQEQNNQARLNEEAIQTLESVQANAVVANNKVIEQEKLLADLRQQLTLTIQERNNQIHLKEEAIQAHDKDANFISFQTQVIADLSALNQKQEVTVTSQKEQIANNSKLIKDSIITSQNVLNYANSLETKLNSETERARKAEAENAMLKAQLASLTAGLSVGANSQATNASFPNSRQSGLPHFFNPIPQELDVRTLHNVSTVMPMNRPVYASQDDTAFTSQNPFLNL